MEQKGKPSSATLQHSSGVSFCDRELSRLINAAIVNREFCELLLTNPARALANGYYGEWFHLTSEEQNLILSIHAASLADFAMQLTQSRQSSCPPLVTVQSWH